MATKRAPPIAVANEVKIRVLSPSNTMKDHLHSALDSGSPSSTYPDANTGEQESCRAFKLDADPKTLIHSHQVLSEAQSSGKLAAPTEATEEQAANQLLHNKVTVTIAAIDGQNTVNENRLPMWCACQSNFEFKRQALAPKLTTHCSKNDGTTLTPLDRRRSLCPFGMGSE